MRRDSPASYAWDSARAFAGYHRRYTGWCSNEIARGQMSHTIRVNVAKIDPRPGPDLSGVNTAAIDKFLANLPGRKDRE
jgi:hypothetical protein